MGWGLKKLEGSGPQVLHLLDWKGGRLLALLRTPSRSTYQHNWKYFFIKSNEKIG